MERRSCKVTSYSIFFHPNRPRQKQIANSQDWRDRDVRIPSSVVLDRYLKRSKNDQLESNKSHRFYFIETRILDLSQP